MRLCPNARDDLNSKGKSSTSLHVSVCTACDLDMVQRECRTLFQVSNFVGDFQRVFLGFGAMRRSYGDCRHQSAQGSFDSELVLLGGDNIGCGASKCPLMRWRRFGQPSRQ